MTDPGKFDKQAWMRKYMREYRKGIRRRRVVHVCGFCGEEGCTECVEIECSSDGDAARIMHESGVAREKAKSTPPSPLKEMRSD